MSGARSSLRLRDHGAGSPVAEQVTRGRAPLEEPARRRVRLSEELQQGPCFAFYLLLWSSSRRQTSRLRRATGTQELRPAPSLLRQAAGDRSPHQEHEQELAAAMGVRGSSVNCRIRPPSAPCVHRLFFIRSGEELPFVPVASSRRSLARPRRPGQSLAPPCLSPFLPLPHDLSFFLCMKQVPAPDLEPAMAAWSQRSRIKPLPRHWEWNPHGRIWPFPSTPPSSARPAATHQRPNPVTMTADLCFPLVPKLLRSVRIRSTTLARLLHGFILLLSEISVAGTGNAMI